MFLLIGAFSYNYFRWTSICCVFKKETPLCSKRTYAWLNDTGVSLLSIITEMFGTSL